MRSTRSSTLALRGVHLGRPLRMQRSLLIESATEQALEHIQSAMRSFSLSPFWAWRCATFFGTHARAPAIILSLSSLSLFRPLSLFFFSVSLCVELELVVIRIGDGHFALDRVLSEFQRRQQLSALGAVGAVLDPPELNGVDDFAVVRGESGRVAQRQSGPLANSHVMELRAGAAKDGQSVWLVGSNRVLELFAAAVSGL